MISKKIYCLFIILFSVLQMNAQTADTLDLYLLIGQSNMAGRGAITDSFKNETDINVLMLDKNNNWVQAKHPLHFDKPSVAGVGPGLSFGIEMSKVHSSKKIGLIPCAVGGTSINSWQPGGFDKATNTHPYDEAMLRLSTAMKSGHLKGILWLQGESDSDSSKAKLYLDKLIGLIKRIRAIAANDRLPFVAGELGTFKEQYKNINNELAKLPQLLPFTAIASSAELKDKGDLTHFNSASAELYGVRFAEKMKALLKK
ncbi:MAG: sialate O-acetylesterase [Ferruginibacter sp.]